MPSLEFKAAETLQTRVIVSDIDLLNKAGVEPFTPEALPHYAAWTRQDMVLVVSLLTSIANYARYAVLLLGVIVALLLFRG
jgi:hypothetical protein